MTSRKKSKFNGQHESNSKSENVLNNDSPPASEKCRTYDENPLKYFISGL